MTAIALVQKVSNLPPVSQAALKLISLLDQATVDNTDVIQVLKYDNVLTAKLLRACNAPSFGMEEPVGSVDQAVFLLGHEQILRTVMSLTFGSIMTNSSRAYTMEANKLWEHSLVSATAVESVMEYFPLPTVHPGVAFTAALLHDIGKLIFALTLSPEQLSEIVDQIQRKQISSTEAEQGVLGTDHAEVGSVLLQSWRLPDSIVEAVENHHRPVLEPEPRLSSWVHVANVVAHHANPPPAQTIHDLRIANPVAQHFEINAEALSKLTVGVRRESERVDRFMATV